MLDTDKLKYICQVGELYYACTCSSLPPQYLVSSLAEGHDCKIILTIDSFMVALHD